MLAKHIIPCLDVTGGRVVKGVNFLELRDAGDPVEIAARYNDQGADELTPYLCDLDHVTFGALGIHMAGETASVGDFRRAVVSLAGPFANLLSFLLLLPLPRAYPAVQLTLFAFHVLPAVPLDGGTALYCLLRGTFSEKTAERTITVSSVLLALTLGTLGFSVLISTGYNFTLLFLAVYILFYLILKQRGNMC